MINAIASKLVTGPDKPVIDDPNVVDKLFKHHRMRVMLAITLGYGLIYTCRLALGIVKKPLIDGGIYTPVELGLIGSALFYAYALGKFTNGFLADHANIRLFLPIGFLLTALCNLAMGFNTALTMAIVLWGLNGWFQGFGAPGSVVAMTAWYSNKERGRTYGIWSTAHSIGEGLTFFGVGTIVAILGWRFGFIVPALIGIGTAAIVYFLLRDRPQTLGLPNVNIWKGDSYDPDAEDKKRGPKSVLMLQLSILKIPSIWILCLASAMMYMTRYGINSWGILYLQEDRGMSLPMAGTMLMISTLTGIVGAIAFGFISDTVFGARRPPANLLFALIEIFGLILIFFGPNNMIVLTIGMLCFGLGLTGLVTSLGGLFAVDIAPNRVAGAAMGVIGIVSYLGAGLQEYISGVLIESNLTVVDGANVYDFSSAIWFWIGSSVISMLLAASLWRVRGRD
ncbi:MAG: MFS transporter [Hyphomonas sp.]|nr:MFS transporter [Hyphomonas sp.]